MLNEGYADGSYQRDITNLLLSNKYDVFLDVGSSIGYFSLIASQHCKRVIAYEASPISFGMLLFNMKFCYNVECKYGFVSGYNTIPKIEEGCLTSVIKGLTKRYNIPQILLKNEIDKMFYYEHYNNILIKMDIEGYELEVLKTLENQEGNYLEIPSIRWYIDVHPTYDIIKEDIKNLFPNRIIEEKPTEALFIQ